MFLGNHFLIALPSIDKCELARTLIYVLKHDSNGAIGFVINKKLNVSFSKVFKQLKVNRTIDESCNVLRGGPMDEIVGYVLHSVSNNTWDSSLFLTPDIVLTTSNDILSAIAEGKGPAKFQIFFGYAGWEKNQLEHELACNAWLTCPADFDILFNISPDLRLPTICKKMGISPYEWSMTQAIDKSHNDEVRH